MHKQFLQHLRSLTLGITLCLTITSSLFAGEAAYLNTPQGKERLITSQWNNTYFQLSPYLEAQDNQGFCGIASIAASLNSLPQIEKPFSADYWPYRFFTQDNLFTPDTSKVKAKHVVAAAGLTLEQIQLFLKALNVKTSIHYGNDLTEASLRALLKTALTDNNHRLIVDFSRETLNQEGHGHFSPIAAYDDTSDSLLILDVAKFKYPPFWVSVSDLLTSIQTIDSDSGKSRGLLIINSDSH